MNGMTIFIVLLLLVVSLIILVVFSLINGDGLLVIISVCLVVVMGSWLSVPFEKHYQIIWGEYNSIKEDLKNPYCSVSKDRIQEFNACLYSYQMDYQNGDFLTCLIFGDELMELKFIEYGK